MIYQGDIKTFQRGLPDVNFRLLIEPTIALGLPQLLPIFATEEQLQFEMNQGYKDASHQITDWLAA